MSQRWRIATGAVALSLAAVACGTATPAPSAPAASARPAEMPSAAGAAPAGAAPAGGPGAVQVRPLTPPSAELLGIRLPDGPGTLFRLVPEDSQGAYRVQEKMVRLPAPNKAVGVTNVLAGEFRADLTGAPKLLASRFALDLRTLKSDQVRRDQALRTRWLESDKYPLAEFTATEAQGAAPLAEGQETRFKLAGTMKIHDTERPLVWEVKATLKGDAITGLATTGFNMSQFNVPPPDVAGMLTVDDPLELEFKFIAKRAE